MNDYRQWWLTNYIDFFGPYESEEAAKEAVAVVDLPALRTMYATESDMFLLTI